MDFLKDGLEVEFIASRYKISTSKPFFWKFM